MGFHKDLTGQDLHAPTNILVENNSGATITKLTCVKFNGQGTLHPQIIAGNGAVDFIRGIVLNDILNGSSGFIIGIGLMPGIDTSSFLVGDSLYASVTGVLTKTVNGPPIAEVLVVDASNGIIYVDSDSPSSGVTDHGALTGLGDDDHSQYHNDTRGDLRYYTQTLLNSGQLDSRYHTEAEIDNFFEGEDTGKKQVHWDRVVSKPAPNWLNLTRSGSNQSGIDTGVDIIMNSSEGNGISYNTSTGVVSLIANKTYRLFANFAMFSIGSSDKVDVEWVKASDNTPLAVGHASHMRSMSSTSNGNNTSVMEVTYKPTVNTDVKLRCTEYTGSPDTVTMYTKWSMATVIEIK